MKVVHNSSGKIFYGLHFYSGVAQYQDDPGQDPYRVFLNEDTLRSMDPTFAGKPIFVEHVDEVDPDINKLRKEADGWVIESFFNSCDGKHWVKFIIVSDLAERAIRKGMRLSNAYIPKSFKDGGLWNGVPYAKEIISAEYEHLAIVDNPRYEESVIMTPDEFKKYNERQTLELQKVANSKGDKKMKFTFFKKSKVENAIDPELQVVLKSGKSISISKLINDAYEKDQDPSMEKHDDKEGESAKSHTMADHNHMVKMHDGSYMKIKDMLSKHKDMHDELEDIKSKKKDKKEPELDVTAEERDIDAEGDLHNDEYGMDEHEEEVAREEHKEELKDDMEEHSEEAVHDDEDEDEGAKKKALQLVEHEEKEIEAAKKKNLKKKNALQLATAKAKADRLRNAHLKAYENESYPTIELSVDRVARGKVRYGS